MDAISIFLIAIGLAMDVFAVAITYGCRMKKFCFWHACKIAVVFGFFHACMPVIGWFIGSAGKKYIMGFDHWVALFLLVAIGGKMIYEALPDASLGKTAEKKAEITQMYVVGLLTVGLAISIDALAVGISFSLLPTNIIYAAACIGGVTFVLSFLGVKIGKKVQYFLGKKVEIIGGVLLLCIGAKILLQHLFFGA